MTGKFTFAQRDEGFDEHIDKSIRGYRDLWNDVVNMSQYFVENESNVVDVGCSTGKLIKVMQVQNDFAPSATYIGVEVEDDFYEDLRNNAEFTLFEGDVQHYEFENCSFVTSIFTLQFMSRSIRQFVINNIYKGLNEGGAFVFAEKTYAMDSFINEMRTFMFYDFKRQNFKDKDILDKEVSLRHQMKPNTKTELYKMCRKAGFKRIETFWQNHAFMGFICIK